MFLQPPALKPLSLDGLDLLRIEVNSFEGICHWLPPEKILVKIHHPLIVIGFEKITFMTKASARLQHFFFLQHICLFVLVFKETRGFQPFIGNSIPLFQSLKRLGGFNPVLAWFPSAFFRLERCRIVIYFLLFRP